MCQNQAKNPVTQACQGFEGIALAGPQQCLRSSGMKVRYKCSTDTVAPAAVHWGPPWLARSSRAICSQRYGKKWLSILNMSCFTWLEIRIYVKTCRLVDSPCFRWFWYPEWQTVKCFGRTWCIFWRMSKAIDSSWCNWLLLFTSRSGASAVPDFLDQPGWQPIFVVWFRDWPTRTSVLGVCSQTFQYFATEMLQGTNK